MKKEIKNAKRSTRKKVLTDVKTDIGLAQENRDSICLMGATIFGMKLKLNNKEKITKDDLNELKKFLYKIDRYDQKIWNQILDKRARVFSR